MSVHRTIRWWIAVIATGAALGTAAIATATPASVNQTVGIPAQLTVTASARGGFDPLKDPSTGADHPEMSLGAASSCSSAL